MLTEILEHYGCEINREYGEFAVHAICHDDKHKSASVNMDKELYACHSCSWGGDGYAVIMKMEGIGFREATEFAARKFGTGNGEVRDGPDDGGYRIPGRKRDTRKRRTFSPSWKRC